MDLQTCKHCGVRVVPMADGICPSCRRPLDEPPSAAGDNAAQRRLRRTAVRRALVCPGAGFAELGYRLIAALVYCVNLCTLLLGACLVIAPGPKVAWACAIMLLVVTGLWLAELLVASWSRQRDAAGSVSARHGWLAVAVLWIGLVVVVVALVASYQPLAVVGTGMSATLGPGEHFVARRHVGADRLCAGSLIVFHSPADTGWGKARWIVVGRILAVPRDKLSIRDHRYVVNGVAQGPAAAMSTSAVFLEVPQAPATLEVPDDCYFVVQDEPEALDSRNFSWVRTGDILSTELYRINWRAPLERVE